MDQDVLNLNLDQIEDLLFDDVQDDTTFKLMYQSAQVLANEYLIKQVLNTVSKFFSDQTCDIFDQKMNELNLTVEHRNEAIFMWLIHQFPQDDADKIQTNFELFLTLYTDFGETRFNQAITDFLVELRKRDLIDYTNACIKHQNLLTGGLYNPLLVIKKKMQD